MSSRLPFLADQLTADFRRHFGPVPGPIRVVFAPYRICPLGAHIDHQEGPVTAMALDRGILLAYAESATPEVRLRSSDFPGEVRFDVTHPGPPQAGDWGNYARGAAHALHEAGHRLTRGLTGILSGPWSEGGLSSSAAVGVACLLALEEANRLRVSPTDNIRLDQAIENRYLGLRNGILDQSGILLSRRNHLTVIDCATADHQLIPMASASPPWRILLAFSGLQRALVGTDYNRRVAECEAAARLLLEAVQRPSEPPVLGRVTPSDYQAHRQRLPPPLDRRAAHFFSEIARVQAGLEAWRRGDVATFGRLMTASGDSSIRQYECGSPPLIDLRQLLVDCPGVYGARFSGAGFRGCCVALVDPAISPAALREILDAYRRRHPEPGRHAGLVLRETDDGARLIASSGSVLDGSAHA